jgi:hypothetical protein
MANISWASSDNCEKWESALAMVPQQNFDVFHLPWYVKLYETGERRAECFVFEDGSETFVYPFLRGPVEVEGYSHFSDISSPYGYSGPVASTKDAGFLSAAFGAFDAAARERGVIAELIKFNPLLQNQELCRIGAFQGEIIEVCKVVVVDVDINDTMRFESVYTHANRKNIKKSQRAGASASFGSTEVQWTRFMELYGATMEANNAQDRYYFNTAYFNAIRTSGANAHSLVSVELEGRIVAVMLVLTGSRNAYCHLIGSDREAMKLGVNNLLHHELIGWAKNHGLEKILIGGGRSNADDDPLLKFKLSFSDILEPFFVGERVFDNDAYIRMKDDFQTAGKAVDRLLFYRGNATF